MWQAKSVYKEEKWFLTLTILCYLQVEKLWVVVLQNQYTFGKNYHLPWIAGRANILCEYLIYIFFQFWAWLLRFLFYIISRRNFEIIFAAFTSVSMSSKSVSQISKMLFQTGNINIIVPHGVHFSRYVQLKSSFSAEKNISGGIWDKLL